MTEIWAKAYPGESWRKQGGMWRGEPPAEYYDDWRHAVTVPRRQPAAPAVPSCAVEAALAGRAGPSGSAVAVTEAFNGDAPDQRQAQAAQPAAWNASPALPAGTVLGVPAPEPGFTTLGQPARITIQLPGRSVDEERRCRFLYRLPDSLLASSAAGEVLGLPADGEVVIGRGSELSNKFYLMLQRDAPEARGKTCALYRVQGESQGRRSLPPHACIALGCVRLRA